MSYKSQSLASGATGYWELSEPSGTFADSYTTSPHALTLTGTANRAQPAIFPESSGSIKFNGSASLLSGTSPAAVSTGAFTIAMLVRYDTAPASTQGLFSLVNSTSLVSTQSARLYMFSSFTVGFGAYLASGTQIYCNAPGYLLPPGTVHHVVAQFEPSVGIRIYIDGALAAFTPTDVATLQSGNNIIVVGAAYEPFYGTSNISDVAYYPTVLSDATVLAHASAAIPGLGTRMNANLVPPNGTLGFFGAARIALSPQAGIVAGYCGAWSEVAPALGFTTASGRDSTGERVLAAAPEIGTLLGFGGANLRAAAPPPFVSTEGTVSGFMTAALSPPGGMLDATGRVSETGNFSPYAGPRMANLVGYGGAVVSVTGLLGVVQTTGTTGAVGAFSIDAPLYELAATGTTSGLSSADLIAPSPRMGATLQAYLIAPGATLTAIGTATVTATYEAYALNLNHSSETNDELTRYTNFPFTHVVRYKNSYFGVAAGGLYLLDGTTDNGAPIEWSFKTGITDFGAPNLKTVSYAYFGGRLGPAATVSIYAGESGGIAYSYSTPRGQLAQNYRQQFGRGLKARYFAFGASGSGELNLDSLEPTVETLTRRI